MNITELSIRRPITTIMLFVSMVAIGLIAWQLPVDNKSLEQLAAQLDAKPLTGQADELGVVRPDQIVVEQAYVNGGREGVEQQQHQPQVRRSLNQ